MQVLRFDNLINQRNVRRSVLDSLPFDIYLEDFALCVIHNRFILLSGGCDERQNSSDKTYLFDS